MKNIMFIMGFVLFFCTVKAQEQTAADEVQQMIAGALKLIAEIEEREPYYYAAEELGNLSGHFPEYGIPNCYGPDMFLITGGDITVWSQWFEQNKNSLKYGTLMRGTHEIKIIMALQPDGTFATSLGTQALERLQKNGFILKINN